MFTPPVQALIDLAKNLAASRGVASLAIADVLAALANDPVALGMLGKVLRQDEEVLRTAFPFKPPTQEFHGPMATDRALAEAISWAKLVAQAYPEPSGGAGIGLVHLVGALARSEEAAKLLKIKPLAEERVRAEIPLLLGGDGGAGAAVLSERLARMCRQLKQQLFGQDHAVDEFVEGLFHAELMGPADVERKGPQALFVFVGPPGVGKTYLAELGAGLLGRPYLRFDMSMFSDGVMHEGLTGIAKSFQGAHPGPLTDFVRAQPRAVLLFDEIEKAHVRTIQLFLQVLDAGRLQDRFHEQEVSFRDTIVIFTTNAGRALYERPNETGILRASSSLHRRTILDALAGEKDAHTGREVFPPAICSRLSTGHPVLFDHMSVSNLARVATGELARQDRLLQRRLGKRITTDELVPLCLVLREGAAPDARTVRAQTELFTSTEIHRLFALHTPEKLAAMLEGTTEIRFALDEAENALAQKEVRALLDPGRRPSVLLVADARKPRNHPARLETPLSELVREHVPEIDWAFAENTAEISAHLARGEFDLVLLDPWLGDAEAPPPLPLPEHAPHGEQNTLTFRREPASTRVPREPSPPGTVQRFDSPPLAARRLARGRSVLRHIRDRHPEVPVCLLSLPQAGGSRGTIDEQFLSACIRAGGARELLTLHAVRAGGEGWRAARDQFASELQAACLRVYREGQAQRLGRQRMVLGFDTVPFADQATMAIRLRNLNLERAFAAADLAEVVDDVQRPDTRFADVIGARSAKRELEFAVAYLRSPRAYLAQGLNPPRGVLLHGPPGTGKTMLARALAGESSAAFLPVSAASFAQIYVGTGPKSVRELFARARKYAPAIVFIDEIDAIGGLRTGATGGGQELANTLNALLTEMDGFTRMPGERPVFVLAATNFQVAAGEPGSERDARRSLDPALVRRFSRSILVELPERQDRQAYLERRLAGPLGAHLTAASVEALARQSTGMSIADLDAVVEAAQRAAFQKGATVADADLEEAFGSVRFGEARPKGKAELERTAYHEAGHTLLYWQTGRRPAYVTVVSRGGHGGYMARDPDDAEQHGVRTRNQLLAEIRVCLAGRAAEMEHYGDEEGLTTGAAQDLEQAVGIARAMVTHYGMSEGGGIPAAGALGAGAADAERLSAAVHAILQHEMVATRQTLAALRARLDAVARALIEAERLTPDALARILA